MIRFCLSLARGRWGHASAHLHAWGDYRQSLSEIIITRRELQLRRKVSDRNLFELQRKIPIPLIKHGNPILTSDSIENQYLPLILAGRTRPIPEFMFTPNSQFTHKNKERSWINRIIRIWKNEGLSSLLYHLGRRIESRLMQP